MEGLAGTVNQTQYDDFIEHFDDAVRMLYNTMSNGPATFRDILYYWHCTHWGYCDGLQATGEKQLKIALEYKCNQPGFDLNSTAFYKLPGGIMLGTPTFEQVANDYSGTGEVFKKHLILSKYKYPITNG